MLKIEKVLPKTNKEGSQISGTSKNGKNWYLWQINGKYDMFGYSEEPPVEVGKEYDLKIDEKITEYNGKEYKNYTASFKKETDKKNEEVMDALRKVYAKVEEGNGMLSQIILDIEGLYEKTNELLKSSNGGKADENI